MIRIIFMGTPDFALSSLEAIYKSDNKLLAVVTQPDRPRGRGKKLQPSPVKKWALEKGIPIYQPENIRQDPSFIKEIKKLDPDLIITAAFGQILPKALLDIPKLGSINVHASLLPKYRGASPIQQAIIEGEEKTGVTIMYMDTRMDTGDIIAKEEIKIGEDDTADQVHDKLALLGGKVLKEVISLFGQGKPKGVPQDDELATYCSKINKSMCELNWDNDAQKLRNLIRGLTPWPGAFTYYKSCRLKLWSTKEWAGKDIGRAQPGTIVIANAKDGIVVACRNSFLQILELQAEAGRRMTSQEYLRGNQIDTGSILGRQGSDCD